MNKRMKNCLRKGMSAVLIGALVFSMAFIPNAVYGASGQAKGKSLVRGELVREAVRLLGAEKTEGEAKKIKDLESGSPYFEDMAAAFHGGLVVPRTDGTLCPEARATNQYMANLFSKVTGETPKELLGTRDPKKYVTQKEFDQFLETVAPNIVGENTEVVKKGNVMVNQPDLTLQNLTVNGNLIIGDGVGDKEAVLHNVTITGSLFVRGGGENSIRITGSSHINIVKMKPVNHKAALKIGEEAEVGTVAILKGSRDVKIQGKADQLLVQAADLTVNAWDAQIRQLDVIGKNINLKAEGSTIIDVLNLEESAAGSGLEILAGSRVKQANIKASGISLTGGGMIDKARIMKDNVKLEVNTGSISIEEGVTGTQIPSSESGGSHTGSGGSAGNGGQDNNNNTANIKIEAVYPKPGSVQVVLSQPVVLEKEAFSISCPTGQDMTIVSAAASQGPDKNKVYDLGTAFYADNTYILTIRLPNGQVIEKEFATNSHAPVLSSCYTERKSNGEAILYVSASQPGILFYLAVPKTAYRASGGADSRSIIGTHIPATPEEIKKNGEQKNLSDGLNTISLTGLAANTAYTVYLATEGGQAGSPVMQGTAGIEAHVEAGDTSGIQIVECDGFHGNEIVLKFSEPIKEELRVSAFTVTCPSQGNITLGSVKTQDSQTFHVYLKENYFMYSGNHYKVQVAFQDGTTASSRFYGDFQWPIITSKGVKRVSGSAIEVNLTVDESGEIYYLINGDSDRSSAITPDVVLNTGTRRPISKGTNSLQIEDVPMEKKGLYMITKDEKGNYPKYVEFIEIP